MLTKHRPRLVVLGLDGLPFSLALELAKNPKFKNLHHLVHNLWSHPITAELPELSPVNWTSFYTACGPEDHGIFGFTQIHPQRYNIFFVDSTCVLKPSLFETLSDHNFISKVINLPNTYPAKPFKGMLVSGFVAPDLKDSVYPKFLYSHLQSMNYCLEADTTRGKSDPEYLFSQLKATLDSRRQVLDLFWSDLAWDLFILVLTETDRLEHFFFPALTDPDHPWHGACLDLLANWDDLLGQVLDRFYNLPEPKRLIVLADHGFTGLKTEFDLNQWLKEANLLHLKEQVDHELDSNCLLPSSKAFALDPGRIYMHKKDRFAEGCLSENEALLLREEIKAGLLELTFEQKPIMEKVLSGDELYPNCSHPQRPDLVCVPKQGIDLKAKFDRKELFGFFGRTGTHWYQDAFFADSQQSSVQRVRQVGQEVLNYFLKPQNLIID